MFRSYLELALLRVRRDVRQPSCSHALAGGPSGHGDPSSLPALEPEGLGGVPHGGLDRLNGALLRTKVNVVVVGWISVAMKAAGASPQASPQRFRGRDLLFNALR